MGGVRLSVCLSLTYLDLTRERKCLGSPTSGRTEANQMVVNVFRGQKVKGQGHQAD